MPKEVRFDIWCENCDYHLTDETDDPCNECLAKSYNVYSTKPLNYKSSNKEIVPITDEVTDGH